MGMTANAIWHSGLSFTGSAGSGFTVPMGASVEDGGGGVEIIGQAGNGPAPIAFAVGKQGIGADIRHDDHFAAFV